MCFKNVRRPLAALALSFCAASGSASAQTADYELRRFDGGPGWLVFGENINVALHVLNPDDPKCHEIGEIIILFETPEQLGDADIIKAAALAGNEHYRAQCSAFGGTPSKQRRVSGFIVGVGEPDKLGRLLGDAKVLDGMLTSFTGTPEFRIRYIASVAEQTVDQTSTPAADKSERMSQSKTSPTSELRRTYDAALAESMANAEPVGTLARITGGACASLTGAWSGSQAECSTERVILFERSGAGTAEWWRASNEDVGLLPWRSGKWELRDDTLIMTFDQKIEISRLTGRLLSGPISETVQFDLQSVNGSELRLAATGGGFSPEALFLGGAEKLFVRCDD